MRIFYSRLGFILVFCLSLTNSYSSEWIEISPDNDKYNLKPVLKQWNGQNSSNGTYPPQENENGFYEHLGVNSVGEEVKWYKFSINFQDYEDPIYLALEGSSYSTNLSLFYKGENGEWIEKKCDYNTPLSNRHIEQGMLIIPISGLDEIKTDFYLKSESYSWRSEEYFLFTQSGLSSYNRFFNGWIYFYTSLVILIILGSIVIGILYKSKLSLAFSFYLICSLIVLLLELNKMTEIVVPDNPGILLSSAWFLYGLFALSISIYSYLLFKEGTMTPRLKMAFFTLIGLAFTYLAVGFIAPKNTIGLMISNLFEYAGFIIFFWAIALNIKGNTGIRLFILGAFLVILFMLINDLHIRNVVFFPQSTYLLYNSLLIEMLLAALGTFLLVRKDIVDLKRVKSENLNLNESILNLETQVAQSKKAYASLANHKGDNILKAPDSYYLNPLSNRELEVLLMLSKKLTNNEISSELNVSKNTVKTHLKKIYSKLGTNNREEAIQIGQDYGLV